MRQGGRKVKRIFTGVGDHRRAEIPEGHSGDSEYSEEYLRKSLPR